MNDRCHYCGEPADGIMGDSDREIIDPRVKICSSCLKVVRLLRGLSGRTTRTSAANTMEWLLTLLHTVRGVMVEDGQDRAAEDLENTILFIEPLLYKLAEKIQPDKERTWEIRVAYAERPLF
ncbi:MAG: hypothetical protein M1150_02310 [Patescibacteria group bacterium]|nr:hypothetical protein [Patescibacteria group bacterium]